MHVSNESDFLKDKVQEVGGMLINLHHFADSVQRELLHLANSENEVFQVKAIHINSWRYEQGCCLLFKVNDGVPDFVEVKGLFMSNGSVFLLVNYLETIGFNEHVHGYQVKEKANSVQLIEINDCQDPYPLQKYQYNRDV